MTRRALLVATLLTTSAACLGGLSPSALASGSPMSLRPRMGVAMGVIPAFARGGQKAFTGPTAHIYTPLVYHGGTTMTGGVTVHTIFWAPGGYAFEPAPPGSLSYIALIEQYLSDVMAASTGPAGAPCSHSACNVFTVEPQFGSGTRFGQVKPGNNTVTYVPGTDAILDKHSYPPAHCHSPSNTRMCLTDLQVQKEVDRVIQQTHGHRGLGNVWYVFLPPDVDECFAPGQCGTNAFAGYHSFSDIAGHGITIYAVGVDPIIEIGQNLPGGDPQGNPDAELAADVAAHEINEAMSDPEGTGWVDPAAGEVGDKCDVGPQRGTPLGYAPDGSPYNQVVNGDQYLVQEMWSNDNRSCVQATPRVSNPLPLPRVSLTQFSSLITGSIERPVAGVAVTVKLVRPDILGAPVTVASGSGRTAADGTWSVKLSGSHVVGDDRDQIDVTYAGPGAPHNDVILTGNGGDPVNAGGWTGWTALDAGAALTNHDPALGGRPSLTVGPCFQAGVIAYTGAAGPPVLTRCSLTTDTSKLPLNSPVAPGDHVTVSSLDNRAFAPSNLPFGGNQTGALVRLTVPVGPPDAAPNRTNNVPFTPTGFPTCTANLSIQAVGCSGLVPGATYTLRNGRHAASGRANPVGVLVRPIAVSGGQRVTLTDSSTPLVTLHVARLRVHILGTAPSVAAGTCSPGEYWGGPLARVPVSDLAGEPTNLFGGAALTSPVCPSNGSAAGMPTGPVIQTDEHSGGATVVTLPYLADTSPIYGETMYGNFTVLAETSGGRPRIDVAIFRAGHRHPVFRSSEAGTVNGVAVRGLRPGRYYAIWTLIDRHGDTRTEITRFIEQAGRRSPRAHAAASCRPAKRSIACHVAFPSGAHARGVLHARLSRGGQVAAMGHARLKNGRATVTMRALRHLSSGTWTITLVTGSGSQAQTLTFPVVVL